MTWRVFKQDPKRKKYSIRGHDHLGVKRQLPAFRDKALSEDLARRVAQLVDYKRQNMPLPPFLAHWVQDLAPEIRDRLAAFNLLDAHSRPLAEHLVDYRAVLVAKGNTSKHVQQTITRIQHVLQGCRLRYWSDFSGSRIQRFIAELKAGSHRPATANTKNKYLDALKSFARWAVQDGRISESPIEYLKPLDGRKVRHDSRHDRRALSADQVRQLIEAAKRGPVRWGMTGPERAMLYRLAVETGLRASELRRLTCGSFHLMGDRPTVTIEAGYNTKQRQLVDVALRPDTASEMRSLLASKLPTAPAFNLPRPERVVYMLREDLEVAGIAYRDETGRVCDFHSLRHTCGTLLAAAGVHPKVIQRVMRHSTITLTMDRYTHAFKSDEAEAIQKLPDLSQFGDVSRSATGTLGPNDPESLAPKRGAIRGATGGQQCTEMPPSVDSEMKETSPSPRASLDVSSDKKHSKDKDSSKRPRWDSNPRWLTPTDLQSAPLVRSGTRPTSNLYCCYPL